MAPRLSGQTSIFGVVFFVSKSPLGIERRMKLEKFAILTRKPRSHARILIYRTWRIVAGLISLIRLPFQRNRKNAKTLKRDCRAISTKSILPFFSFCISDSRLNTDDTGHLCLMKLRPLCSCFRQTKS